MYKFLSINLTLAMASIRIKEFTLSWFVIFRRTGLDSNIVLASLNQTDFH